MTGALVVVGTTGYEVRETTVERAGQSWGGLLVFDLAMVLLLKTPDRRDATYSDGRRTAGDGDLLSLVDSGVWGSGHDGGGHDGEGGVLELHLDGRFVYKKRFEGEKRVLVRKDESE